MKLEQLEHTVSHTPIRKLRDRRGIIGVVGLGVSAPLAQAKVIKE